MYTNMFVWIIDSKLFVHRIQSAMIIADPPHSWQDIVIHGKPYNILYTISLK